MCVPPYSPLSSFNKGSLGKLREGEVEREGEEGGEVHIPSSERERKEGRRKESLETE